MIHGRTKKGVGELQTVRCGCDETQPLSRLKGLGIEFHRFP